MIAPAELVRCVPGFLAALLLAMLPACATGRTAQDGPIVDPHIQVRHAPRDAEVPAGIQRGAAGYHPDNDEQWYDDTEGKLILYWAIGLLCLFIVAVLIACLGGLYDVIHDALDSPSTLSDPAP